MIQSRLFPASLIAVSALTAASLPGCQESPGITPEKLEANNYQGRTSDRQPLFFALNGGTLMMVTQKEDELYFFRNYSGYTGVGIGATRLGIGIEGTVAVGNKYFVLDAWEALAYLDYNIEGLLQAADQEFRDSRGSSVDPKLIRELFSERIAIEKQDKNEQLGFGWEFYDDQLEWARGDLKGEPPIAPIVLKVADEVLLQVEEADGELHFFKSSQGYGTQSAEAHLLVASVEGSLPTGQVFDKITALEAKALLNGNWRKLYDLALKEEAFFLLSVSPELIKRTFVGSVNPEDSDEIDALVAKKGDLSAADIYKLAKIVLNGAENREEKMAAFSSFLQVASLGDMRGEHAMGVLLSQADLENVNWSQVRACFDKAAKAGNEIARRDLAIVDYFFLAERGSEQEIQALLTLSEFRDSNDPVVATCLAAAYCNGRLNNRDGVQIEELLRHGIKNRVPAALVNQGLLHLDEDRYFSPAEIGFLYLYRAMREGSVGGTRIFSQIREEIARGGNYTVPAPTTVPAFKLQE